MFYTQFVLAKKGPLAKIWLAAHWEKKLSKAQVYETNVQDAVDEVLKPKVKMALRTTGHLLLGIVRIYSRKAKYLLADCNEAFLKIKMAFRPGQVDLADECREAQMNAITLPEVFHDFDAALPDFNEVDMQTQLQMNQSRIDDITLKEDLPNRGNNMPFGTDFGMDDFGENAAFGDILEKERDGSLMTGSRLTAHNFDNSRLDDVDVGAFVDRFETPIPDDFGGHLDDIFNEELAKMDTAAPGADLDIPMDMIIGGKAEDIAAAAHSESFALEPLDASMMQGLEKIARPKRKRKLIIDDQRNISGEEMKSNMADYRDTIVRLELAPPTKKLMQLKETGAVDKLFQNPGCSTLHAPSIVKIYQSHLVLKSREWDTSQSSAVLSEMDMIEHIDFDHVEQMRDLSIVHEERRDGDDDELSPPIGAGGSPRFDGGNAAANDAFSPKENNHTSADKKKEQRRSRTAADRSLDDDDDAVAEDDHRWTKRTQVVLNSIAAKLKAQDDDEPILFTDLTKGAATRKSAAQKFYTLLVLKKWQAIDVVQSEPFAPIAISAGPNMNNSISL